MKEGGSNRVFLGIRIELDVFLQEYSDIELRHRGMWAAESFSSLDFEELRSLMDRRSQTGFPVGFEHL